MQSTIEGNKSWKVLGAALGKWAQTQTCSASHITKLAPRLLTVSDCHPTTPSPIPRFGSLLFCFPQFGCSCEYRAIGYWRAIISAQLLFAEVTTTTKFFRVAPRLVSSCCRVDLEMYVKCSAYSCKCMRVCVCVSVILDGGLV